MTGLLEYLSPLLDFELLKVIWQIFPYIPISECQAHTRCLKFERVETAAVSLLLGVLA